MSDQLSADLQSLRIDRAQKPQRSNRWVFVVALVVLGGGGVFAARKYVVPLASAGLTKTEISTTEVSTIFPAQGQIDLTTTGYVVPQSVAKVGAKIVGRVLKANVKEWENVKEGQLLFTLDPSDQKAAIASAQARVLAARARAQAARARTQEVNLQFEREKKLAETGSVSKAGAEDLGARVHAMNEQARASDVEALALQAEVASMQTNLNNLTIISPINGVASTKPVQVGDVVRPDQILVEISDMSSLVVEADVAEARLSLVKMGAPCEIVLDAYPGQRFRGAVVEVSPVLDRAKASAKVKVKFVDKADLARGQMGAKINFMTQEASAEQLKEQPKKVVPTTAVVERDGKKVVFLVTGDTVKMTPVNLGPAIRGSFELLDEIPSGTKVVNNPPATLSDGQSVKEAAVN